MGNLLHITRLSYMQKLFIIFFILSSQLIIAQSRHKVSLQFLGSTYSPWTLGYERNVFVKKPKIIVGIGLGAWKSKDKTYVTGTFPWEYKSAPIFFHNSIYLKYLLSSNERLNPHVSIGSVYSVIANKSKVGNEWKNISRLDEYSPIEPSMFFNLGLTYDINKKFGVNSDVYLYKEYQEFNETIVNSILFFGVGLVYNL